MSHVKEAVLFDMDGVLIDSETYWKEFWTKTVFPRVESGQPTLAEVTGRNYDENLIYIDETYGLPKAHQHYETITEEFAESIYEDEASVTDGMPGLFATIRDAGIAVGIVSSSRRSWIRSVVDRSALGPLDLLLSAEEVDEPGKPEPHVYAYAADSLGIDPRSCVVIEDSVNGVRSAAAAGASVIRYACDHDVDPIPEADAVAGDADELRTEIVARLDTSKP